MSSEKVTVTRYPIEVYDPVKRRFRRARWMATWETFPDKPFRIIGPPVTSDPFDPWAMYGPAQTQKR